jgi:hypothetical protein
MGEPKVLRALGKVWEDLRGKVELVLDLEFEEGAFAAQEGEVEVTEEDREALARINIQDIIAKANADLAARENKLEAE